MALPSTGGTWAQILQPDLDPNAVRKGVITDILIRDYLNSDGTPNSLAASAAGLNTNGVFTPFATDGNLRQDLLASSTSPNQGFYHIGLLKEDGWTFTPNLTVQETEAAQTIWTIRNDVTKETGELMFTAREWKPLVDFLRMDLPVNNPADPVPDLGVAGYSVPAPAYQNLCERQIIALGVDGENLFSITCPRVSQQKLGKTAANKKDPLDLEFTYALLLDPFTSAPYIISHGGAGWLGLGGAPTFDATPPVATAVTGAKATVAFDTPTGIDGPFTYTVTQQVGGTGSFTPSTLSGSPVVVSGTTTVTATTLTASSTYIFKVIASGTNNVVATSLPSNSITATA